MPNFTPGSGGLSMVVVWLRMPGLPLDYWEKSIILQMAAKAGMPLAVDEAMKKGKKSGFARVKIEVDLKNPLRGGTYVKGKAQWLKERFWQVFIYENLPNPCCRCGRVDHEEAHCTFTSVTEPADVSGDRRGKAMMEEMYLVAESSTHGGEKGNDQPENQGYGPWMVTHLGITWKY
ncbi:uncharacterized protein LOC120105509 [Phoenix dactylifera]|uniref:Uncharacterized protein LOC120105509 n=1 Tax=Phoenix dactylifera TaxID=42345 RepID=A0A8B8ZIK2_PHODC|nr:uncharacterized protein LOC120105509 [Phoenix dactylifera]